MYDWTRMCVGMLGAGIENISLTRYLLAQGAKVIVYDQNDPALVGEKMGNLESDNLIIVAGKNYVEKLSKHDLFFRSPGMPLGYAQEITKQNGKLSSAMQLFFELCPAKIIGVTGTKGKGTVSSLIFEILSRRKSNVYLAGNIGRAPFDFIDDLKENDWVVMEISSFQLEDMTLSPHIAVVLNITPDHLAASTQNNPNYHKNFDEYVMAKKKILEYQKMDDYAVIVASEIGKQIKKVTAAEVYVVAGDSRSGCVIIENKFVVRLGGKLVEIIGTNEVKLLGQHNLINIQAAIMASFLAGANRDDIGQVVADFKGLPHRLEFVREVGGKEFYDDSYATDPDAAVAAIRSFIQPVVLICGGASKGADFDELAQAIKASSVKAAILMGDEADRIEKALEEANADLALEKNLVGMKDIVGRANELAKIGDVVLLSPGCASFGLFESARDRGEQFQRTVNGIK
ncbi:MAG: UDP-N-acetylmuramoyl-L-alanine--D-glutamate ligase [bacterium]|nr:UDP-N-acetylmuramoyl-L-alanine--D-glutamate ligase [bacterium]